MIPIQVTIAGYSGKPCSLFAAYDESNKVLVISLEASHRRSRRDGCAVITNDKEIDRDSLFTDENLKDSIHSFFTLNQGVAIDGKSSRLVFSDKAARANPAQSIEKDSVDSSGQKFRVSETISCAQVAALAACWYADTKYGTFSKVIGMFDALSSLDGSDDYDDEEDDINRFIKGEFISI